jgi:hypothetical protein
MTRRMTIRADSEEATWRDGWDVRTGRLQGKLLDGMDEMSVRDGVKGRNFLPLQYSSIRLDDGTDDDSSRFRGGYLTGWMRCLYRTASREATWRDGWDVCTGQLQGKLLDGMDEMSVRDGVRGRNFLPLQYIIWELGPTPRWLLNFHVTTFGWILRAFKISMVMGPRHSVKRA